ncbi:MAG: flagellar hook capping FlgD N-terminal domain-containing protein [Burkholderiaceae bacterium]
MTMSFPQPNVPNTVMSPVTAAKSTTFGGTTNAGEQVSFQDLMAASQVDGSSNTTKADVATVGADNDQTEDRFLALLVAQMRNQDPLNPLENAEVTTQLAQINTVRGVEDLGKTMKEMLARTSQSSPVASADMIDRSVMVQTSTITLADDQMDPVQAAAELTAPAGAVVAEIYGADGQAVREIALGPHAAGLINFEWDGKDQQGDWAKAGNYQFRVRAVGEAGEESAATSVAAKVVGVQKDGDSVSLRLEGGQLVPVDSVKAVF